MILKYKHAEGEEVITCDKCGTALECVPVEDKERVIYSYSITHKRDRTPIKYLKNKGAFLGTVELGLCPVCDEYRVVLDSMGDDPEGWAKLPKWEKVI